MENREQKAKEILSGLSNGYLVMYVINLRDDSFMKIGSIKTVNEIVKQYDNAQTAMNTVVERLVNPEFQQTMRDFINLRTLQQRLRGRTLVTCDYQGALSAWCCAQFMPVSYEEDGSLKEVVYAVQHIQERKMESLVYQKALESNANFIYYFDLTDGILGKDFPAAAKKLVWDDSVFSFPMDYNQFVMRSYEIMKARPVKNRVYMLTREEMLERYEKGETRFRVEYYSEVYDRYFGDDFFLTPNDENGHIIAVAVGSDITKEYLNEMQSRRELEHAYNEAKRANHAKTNFLSRISHDMRTPINGVMGMLHILKENIDQKEKALECIEKIEEAGLQLKYMINDVLDMNHIESGKVVLQHETFDLAELLQSFAGALQVLADEKGVTLILPDYDLEHRLYIGSPVHISRVITNIVTNAVKYTPTGGRVEIRIAGKLLDEKHIRFDMTVKDTGIGMSEEFLQKIYEPFVRENLTPDAANTGNGLGMTITKELVTLMEGEIRIESVLGQGTTVTVGFPLEISAADIKKVEPNKETYSLQGKNALLVEDNLMNLEIAKYILEEEGIAVDTAVNGQIAVDRFLTSAPGTYDFILMDIRMPVMNGLDATRNIRESSHEDAKTIPILAMSANAFVEDIRTCLNAGMNDHIAKPLDIEGMISKIAKCQKNRKCVKEA